MFTSTERYGTGQVEFRCSFSYRYACCMLTSGAFGAAGYETAPTSFPMLVRYVSPSVTTPAEQLNGYF